MVLNNTSDAIFLLDVKNGEFKYRKINKAHKDLTGLSNREIRGRIPLDIAEEEIGQTIRANYQECVDTKSDINYEDI